MSLPRYPKYKDSGVEWLGEVPEHWGSVNLKWVSQIYSGGTPDKLNVDYWTDGTIPWLNSGAVNQDTITEPSTFITQEAFEKSAAKWVKAGALVMALAGQGKTKGMVAQLGIRSTCNQSMAAIVPADQFSARFLYWWLVSNYENIRNLAGGDLRDGLNLEILGSIPCPLLPVFEQASVAALLDRETAKIDALVDEQRRLIELLKEKRQAVISHAVTKGLNPDAPMRDSGIQWLGQVPTHWTVRTVAKSTTKITNGFVGPTRDILTDEGLPYVQATHIKNGRVNFGQDYFVRRDWSDAHSKSILAEGDVLIVQTGAGTGDVGLVSGHEVGFNCHALIILSPDSAFLTGDYLSLILRSDYGQAKLTSIQTGAMHPHLNCGEVKFVEIPVPPRSEQVSVVHFLRSEESRMDALIAEATHAIDLLQERRTALISAAVTGKIDVRELVAKEAA